MATSGEGEATYAAASTSGAGGKFRKMPFRRTHKPTTPYDRPPSAMRGINNHDNGSKNSGSLFTKLVVDPASKLITHGAHRFFASVFRNPLPPPPSQPPERNDDLIDEAQVVVSNNQSGAQKSGGGDFTHPLNSSSSDGISELEQLLKQKTFSRSEIGHLTELLQSRAAESCFGVDSKRTEMMASDFGRYQPIASSPLEENINEGGRSQGVVSTTIINSRVTEDDMASPAELARAYMGSRPSKVSPSMLGTQSLAENGFITPRSRGKSAIYKMDHTPYSRIRPHYIHKGSVLTDNGYGGPSMSSHHSLAEQSAKFESKPMALKRRSSVLDDDLGSVGPIRRIRQKPNLLASRIPFAASGTECGSDSVLVSSQLKLPLIFKPKNSVTKTVRENQDDSIPSASYTHVPSKSSEVAARILQHLENLTPKEKSSESKLVTVREKPYFRLTSSILHGQAVKSMKDVNSSQLLLDFQDGQKVEDKSTATLPDARDVEKSIMHSDLLNPVTKNDFVESMKVPGPTTGTVHSVKNGVVQPPLKKRAFRMTAQEDDGIHCYGLAPTPLAEGKGPTDTPFVDSDVSVTKEPILVKANIQQKPIVPSARISNKTTESGSLGAHMIGLGNGGSVFSPSSSAIQTEINSHSVDLFGKLKETKDLPPLFQFSSRTVDKFPPLPPESSKEMPESKTENSSSLIDVLPSATALPRQSVIPEHQSGFLHPPKAGDANGKSHILSSTALNGPLVLRSPAVSFTAVSCDANQISTDRSSLLNPSTSISCFGSTGNSASTPAAICGNLFGSNVAPSILGGPVSTFGAIVDPSATVSAALTTNNSYLVDLKTKVEKEPNFGSSSGIHSVVPAFAVANSGSSTSGLNTLASNSTAHNLQGSPFAGANKFLVSGVETVTQSTSIQSFSSVSIPSSNMNTFGNSLSNSQFAPHPTFGFSTSASSSDSIAVVSSGEPTPSVFRFGGSTIVTAVPNTASSFTSSASGISKFGSDSSAPSSANNFLSSNTASTSPFTGFSLGATSATFAPTNATSTVFSSSTSPSSSGPIFSFTTASPAMSSQPSNIMQPMFGNTSSSFAASPGNGDQMITEDSMAEDPVLYSAPSIPVFGQPAVSPSPSSFVFGSTAASPANPFSSVGQQSQVTSQNPSSFQGSSGSFSLGSGGGDKSTRKFIKVNRNKHRK